MLRTKRVSHVRREADRLEHRRRSQAIRLVSVELSVGTRNVGECVVEAVKP